MWQSPRAEGFVELEQDFARLLKSADGKKWLSRTVTANDGNLWGALKKEIPGFFAGLSQLNFVCSDQGGVRFFDFPQETTEAEIQGNLQLKRKEYFNVREELLFKIRMGAPRSDKTREVLVSYLPKQMFADAEKLCRECGISLGRLTTSIDALVGAYHRQLQRPVADTCVILQVGYSHVNILAVKGQEILSIRSLLTGSLRELENLLFSGFSLPKADVWDVISGIKTTGVPAIEEAIRTNRLELMTHIGSVFAELRGKKQISEKSVFYISNSMVEEPQLGMMVSERFGIQVELLAGMHADESVDSPESARAVWLSGAHMPAVANLVPPVSRASIHLAVPVRVAVMAALVLAAAPLPFLNVLKMRSEKELATWQDKHRPIEALETEFKAASAEQAKLVTLASEITADIDRRGFATSLVRHLTEELPPFSRLEKIEVNLKDDILFVNGYTVDAETALRYLDRVKMFAGIGEPEITIGDVDSRRIKFEITARKEKKGK